MRFEGKINEDDQNSISLSWSKSNPEKRKRLKKRNKASKAQSILIVICILSLLTALKLTASNANIQEFIVENLAHIIHYTLGF